MVRLLRWLLGVLAAIGVLYFYFAAIHPIHRMPDHALFDRPAPWIIAHQGGRGLWPENTLYAFEHCREMGVDMLEMDLRATADGQIVVMHDETVDRTANGSGLVAEMTLEKLRALDAGYRFQDEAGEIPFRGKGLKVPELREVLVGLPTSKLNLEMKDFTPELAASLCAELRERDAEGRVLIASFGQDSMDAFRRHCPLVATSATMREALSFFRLYHLRLGSLYRAPAVAFQVPETFGEMRVVEPRLLELTGKLNVRVQVWTVNEEDDMRRLLSLGVQGILTDYPDRLLAILGRDPGASASFSSSFSSSLSRVSFSSSSSSSSFSLILPGWVAARRSRAIATRRRSTLP